MDSATCNIIYVDRNVRAESQLTAFSAPADIDVALGESVDLRTSVQLLLEAFGNAHVCATGNACVSTLFELHDTQSVELKPTIVLIDTPHDEQRIATAPPSRGPSPHSKTSSCDGTDDESPDGDVYGLRLLERILYETHSRNLGKLVVPVSVVTFPPAANSDTHGPLLPNRSLLRGCLDCGAADVMMSPLHSQTLTTLEVHAYRAHKEAAREQQAQMEITRGRKRSWVGVHDEQPFSYLREAMVSNLMSRICRPGEEHDAGIGSVRISVSTDRRAEISRAVGDWHFCAHDFSDDQLLVAASLIFKHAFNMPELEPWRIPTDQLITFLVACRAAYNTFVPYHNFRHAVDVLQATFNFLVHVGALPPYPPRSGADATPIPKSPLALLLKPFEVLTLLISAIGHDVGHPGVNNGFLVVLNAPLAQLYNDRSVLESFHCAAYSQILRRYWPAVFEDTKMRSLMISSILATDMGLHFDYMSKLGSLQERLAENNSTESWNGRMLETETALVCALLIKCADISNVARKYETALQWMYILCDEFSRQSSMEDEIGIVSSLIAEPRKDFLSMAKAQLGFMNMFALPLFQGVADVLPGMVYTVFELETNRALFQRTIQELPEMEEERRRRLQEGALSPRSMSLAISPRDSKDSSSGKTVEPPMHGVPEELQAAMRDAGSSPPEQQPQQIPNVPGEYRELNGLSCNFESVAAFAASDPFSIHDTGGDHTPGHSAKQRCSETTEGSNSAPYSGDWASQATSATTGKMPLSPSTQGTSIISQESVERPPSAPAPNLTASEFSHLVPPMPPIEPMTSEEEQQSNGSSHGKLDKSLKKKPSRFRMNALNLFRRNRGASSPSSAGEPGV